MSETQRVAIVTGAAGGIGRALVGGLLGAGIRVAAVDRTADGLAALAEGARERQQGANLMTIEADLARDEAAAEIVAASRARFGTIDILVNNAGVGQATIRTDNRQNPIKFWEVTPEQWKLFVAVHTNAPMALSRALVHDMMRQKWGRIVNVTTSLGTVIRDGSPTYGPSKAALEAFSAIIISRRQRHTVLQIRHACQKSRDLVRAQHYWQMRQLACVGDALDHRRAPERHAVKEAQGADRLVESVPGDAPRDEVHLVGADLRQSQPVRRPLKISAELRYRMHVTSLRRRRQISDLHVLNHPATQRAHLGHLGNLLSQDWVSTTTILSDGRPPRPTPYLPQLLRERFSSIGCISRTGVRSNTRATTLTVRWSLKHAQYPGQTDGRSRRIRQNGRLFSFNAPCGRGLVLPSRCGMVAAEFLPVISGSRGRSIGRG